MATFPRHRTDGRYSPGISATFPASDRSSVLVLHVVTSTHRRGAEVFATELSAALDGDGLRSDVVALGRAATGPALDVEALAERPRDPRAVLGLRRRAAAADVVVAHGSATLPAAVLALAGTPTPFVYRVIGDPAYWTASSLRRARVGLQLRRAASVAVYYEAAATTLTERLGVDPARIEIIPKGVPVDEHPPADDEERARARRELDLGDDEPVVAFVGALRDEKNPRLAVVAARRTGAALLVVGDGPDRSALEREFAGERSRFLGALDDVRPVLAAADAVVLTSRTEGVPGVLIEAGLAARPTVTTAVGGVREVVEDGVTGFVVVPEVEAVAEGLGAALADRDRLGEAARGRCLARFDLADTAAAWRDLVLRTARDRRG